MNRMILLVVAMMSMTMTFAKTEKVQSVSTDKSYEIKIDMRRLGETLGLTFDQIEMVEGIYDNFNSEMRKAATEKWYKRGAIIDRAVRKNVKDMHDVLNDKQYHTYLQLFGTTLRNWNLR